MQIERRELPVELRVKSGEGENETPTLQGYGAVFNSLSEPLWGFREQIANGAFATTIQHDDVRFLFNHNPDHVLGRNKAQTLTLTEDEKGLRFEAKLPDTQFARDLAESVRRGDIDQCSFGFTVSNEEWNYEPEEPVRTLREVKLFDVSLVTYPAYQDTSASVRSMKEVFEEQIAQAKKEQKPEVDPAVTASSRARELDMIRSGF
jgi:hypothetical protein